MTTVVIMPGGFHPFHPGHLALYQSAQRTFSDAEVYVAATNDKSGRPFDIADKQKIAYAAGVEPGHFVQVKSPFQAMEITSQYNPDRDTVIFVRSEKDAKLPPKPGGVKKDGSPSYLQPLLGARRLEPFSKHAYMAYLPTIEFGPGAFTSASEIRTAWPKLNPKRKLALVMSLYPNTQQDPAGAKDIVRIFDQTIGGVAENQGWAATYEADGLTAGTGAVGGMHASYQDRYNQPIDEDYVEENKVDPIEAATVDFYKNEVGDVSKKPVDNYKEIARELLGKTEDPGMRKKIMDILVQGNKNPYIQGGIITTIAAIWSGGVLHSASRMGLTPQQTNMMLQAILNTVVPTVVSRLNGKSWSDTAKYTLASAGIGTGIAAMTETGRKK